MRCGHCRSPLLVQLIWADRLVFACFCGYRIDLRLDYVVPECGLCGQYHAEDAHEPPRSDDPPLKGNFPWL